MSNRAVYIYLLASERSERDTLRSVQLRITDIYRYIYILLASERSERDTLRSVQLRIADIYIYIYIYIYYIYIYSTCNFFSYNP